MEWYSNYRSETRVSDKVKVLNIWGTALTVHVMVLDCRECSGSGGWVESHEWWFVM